MLHDISISWCVGYTYPTCAVFDRWCSQYSLLSRISECLLLTYLPYAIHDRSQIMCDKLCTILCTVEPLLYDHPQNHIGVVV